MARRAQGQKTKSEEERRLAKEENLAKEEQRLAYKTRASIADKRYKLLRTTVIAGAVVACFFFMSDAFKEMAGKSTSLSAVIDAVGDLSVNEWVAASIAVLCGAGWFIERRVRRKTIKGQAQHIKELESRLDPKRKSSGLLSDGQTKKGDKDA